MELNSYEEIIESIKRLDRKDRIIIVLMSLLYIFIIATAHFNHDEIMYHKYKEEINELERQTRETNHLPTMYRLVKKIDNLKQQAYEERVNKSRGIK